MRLKHKAHGVIANVDDETGKRMLAGAWELADKKTTQRRTVKKDEDAGGHDSAG